MDRGRYRAYVAAGNAIAREGLNESARNALVDLAEGLLLARDDVEAEAARGRVPETLSMLVERGDLSGPSADRLWVHMKACGPTMHWAPSWDRSAASERGRAVRGQ
jgi:hypothetical protein